MERTGLTLIAEAAPQRIAGSPLRVLHVGAGGDPLPEWLAGAAEVRLDIDAHHQPDIVASVVEMGEIGVYDVVLGLHVLEHLYPYDVPRALGEIYRVLVPGGRAVIAVPDLEEVRPTEEVVYVSPAGPITGLDMFYGLSWSLETMPHMAHHTGFTSARLHRVLTETGFSPVVVRRLAVHNLLGIGVKP